MRVMAEVVGGQAALALPPAHRAAGGVEADAEVDRGRDLHVDEPLLAAGEQVEVIGGGGAAGEEQLAQAHPCRGVDGALVEAAPHVVQLAQPAEERGLLHPGHVAGEDLRQMVVSVHEAGKHHLAPGVDRPIDLDRHGHRTRAHMVDAVVVHQHPTVFEAGAGVVHGHEEPRAVNEGAHGRRDLSPPVARAGGWGKWS